MSRNAFSTYLNDHLAGAAAAIDLLDRLCESARGTSRERLFEALKSEIEQDRAILLAVLHELGGKESLVRKTAARLAERLGEAKLKLDDPGTGELRMLEALESLGLGILGKLALWRALEANRAAVPALRNLDFATLKRRATTQHEQVEAERLGAAGAVIQT